MKTKLSLRQHLKNLFIGKSRDLKDSTIFHKLSLVAFFAWVGLGADGISSSCYGPQEAFLALGEHTYLSIFVALGTVLTIFVISAGYSQIIEIFPAGGGGYLVASKLLSPTWGMISGCALLIDYVLTIAVSITSGTDAIFSLLPPHWQAGKLGFALTIVAVLMLLNIRGTKESIFPLVPIFLTFLFTHILIIIYAFFTHLSHLPHEIVTSTTADFHSTLSQTGVFGILFLILRAYSMGAGTYTGIEAISNGVPILREPKVQTAKRTMRYMAISLAFIVTGLMLAYLVYKVAPESHKTLNAVLFERATKSWDKNVGYIFVLVALASEAAILFVASQTGFLGGPRVLANMAIDHWFPRKFSTLSDRLVIQNGVLIMGGLALAIMTATHGSVRFLVVLYSINVFITFVLSQLGMVRYWWGLRQTHRGWFKKMLVNGVGLILTAFILLSMIIFKFYDGGWITLAITGTLAVLAVLIKRHYARIAKLLRRLNSLVAAVQSSDTNHLPNAIPDSRAGQKFDANAKTAVFLVNGFNGMGLHTLFGVIRLFGGIFKNFVFVQVGVLNAGNFKGVDEVERLQAQVERETKQYVDFMKKHGYHAEGVSAIAVDVIEEVNQMAPTIMERYPHAVFFGGQLIFPNDSFILRLLHNHTVFALQKKLYRQGIPFVILPIRV